MRHEREPEPLSEGEGAGAAGDEPWAAGLAIALSAAIAVAVCFRPSGWVDLWWTLAAGDYILAHGDVPRTALWTLEAIRDFPYVCHNWLSALAFSAVVKLGGVDAAPAVPTLLALGTLASVVALCRQLGASWWLSAGVAALLLYGTLQRMSCRSESFGYLYLALSLCLLARYLRTQRPAALLALLPVAWLWANSHASFLILFALLPCAALGMALDAWRREGFRADALAGCVLSRDSAALAIATLAVGVTALLNPYGVDLLRSVLEPADPQSRTLAITEWAPLYSSPLLLRYFALPAVALGFALWAGWGRLSFVSVGFAILFAALGLSAVRHVSVLWVGAAFVLGDYVSGLELRPRARRSAAAAGIAALLVALGIALDGRRDIGPSFSERPSVFFGAKTLDYVRRNVRGNVLNSYHLGGVLIYFAYPQVRVSMDPRANPYPSDYYSEYLGALFGTTEETRAFLERYEIDHIIVSKKEFQQNLAPKLEQLDGFRLAYRGPRSAVVSRLR